jgi:hypothetical protein
VVFFGKADGCIHEMPMPTEARGAKELAAGSGTLFASR